jgi:transcriptional regulator with XRE-family HTH domain
MLRDTSVMPRQTPHPPGPDDLVIRRIAYEREQRGWSTAEVARRLTAEGFKISQSSVWAIENDDRRKITLAEAVAFADLYGLDIADMFRAPRDVGAVLVGELLKDVQAFRRDARQLLQRLFDLIKRADDLSGPDAYGELLSYLGATGTRVGVPTGALRKQWGELADLAREIGDNIPERAIAITFGSDPASDEDG